MSLLSNSAVKLSKRTRVKRGVNPLWLESRVNMKRDASLFARRCHADCGRRMR